MNHFGRGFHRFFRIEDDEEALRTYRPLLDDGSADNESRICIQSSKTEAASNECLPSQVVGRILL